MSYLDNLRDAGLPVNWRTLLIGLEGPGKYPPVITLNDVCVFANEQLAGMTASSDGAVAIMVASTEDPAEIRTVLRKLADDERSEATRETRKWRLVLLEHVMAELPEDPLYGLIALTEFWERFDFPADSPHSVQGRGNQIAPTDYFTKDNYRRLVQQHKNWIRTETTALQA